jgi:hypothetical protein
MTPKSMFVCWIFQHNPPMFNKKKEATKNIQNCTEYIIITSQMHYSMSNIKDILYNSIQVSMTSYTVHQ